MKHNKPLTKQFSAAQSCFSLNKIWAKIFFFAMLLVPLGALADTGFDPNNALHLSISVDNTNGKIKIEYLCYDDEGDDDAMDRFTLFYKSGNQFVEILDYSHDGFYNRAYDNINTNGGKASGMVFMGAERRDNIRNGGYWAMFEWQTIPDVLLGRNLEFYYSANWDQDDDQYITAGYDWTLLEYRNNPLNISTISAPTNLSATQNSCGKVTLNWNAVTNYAGINTNNATYSIYRNNLWIGNTSSLTYDDTNVTKGVSYSYYVKATVYAGSTVHRKTSNTTTGYAMGVPYYPPNMYITQDKCASTVQLGWQIASTAYLNHFIIERVENGSSSAPVVTELAANVREFVDPDVQDGKQYEYRLYAYNACDEGTSTSKWIETDFGLGKVNFSSVNTSSGSVVLNWPSINCYNATNVRIQKRNMDNGVEEFITLGNTATTYTDSEVKPCVEYRYKLQITRNTGVVLISDAITTNVSEDLTNVLSAFKASKGHFPNRVELTWQANKANLIQKYKIWRREYNVGEYQLIKTLSDGSQNWNDETVEAGKYYDYKIQAFATCINTEMSSNVLTSVGFRNPTGIIAGQINYEGGTAVEGVKVLVNPSDENAEIKGSCLRLSTGKFGSSLMTISKPGSIDFSKDFAIDMWLDLQDVAAGGNVLMVVDSKLNTIASCTIGDNMMFFNYGSAGVSYSLVNTIFPKIKLSKWKTGQWNHVKLVYQTTSIKLLINGEVCATAKASSVASSARIIGLFENMNGYADELRFWNGNVEGGIDNIDGNRIANGNESGLMACYHFNEGTGSYAFDCSREGNNYNENHADLKLTGWSTDIPDESQLGFYAYTAADGSYLIEGVPYSGNGEMFQLTPSKGLHSFDPAKRSVYIGDNNYVHNNQDFTDVSSFNVQGRVIYDNTDFGVEGATVLVDGRPAVGRDNMMVQTNASGEFSVSVPIGDHYISVQKNGHEFANGVYPGVDAQGYPTTKEFIEPITGLQFRDITKVKLVGRIVGGPVEAAKKIGFKKSVNNIGQAGVKISPVKPQYLQPNTTENNFITFYTNDTTGEYELWVIPEEFKVDSVGFGSIKLEGEEYFTNIDLVNKLVMRTETDSVFTDSLINGELVPVFDSIQTYKYHHRRDWIYRVAPSIAVMSGGTNWLSDSVYVYTSEQGREEIDLKLADNKHAFGHPVFTQLNKYKWDLSVFEQYTNYQTSKVDDVPVTDAKITVNNNFAANKNATYLNVNAKGEATYSFVGGFPNTTKDGLNEENSYLQSASIKVNTQSGKTSEWPENGDPYYAYLFGGYPTGNNFVTTGPNKVDMILRDPPGSKSYAYIKQGSVTETSSSYSTQSVTSKDDRMELDLGYKNTQVIGTPFLAVEVEIDARYNEITKTKMNKSYVNDSTHKTVVEFEEAFYTSDLPEFTGSEGDVFLGHSTNLVYGLSNKLGIVKPTDVADENYVENENWGGYAIGVRKGLRINPEFDTYFVYTQKHIENNLIPNIIGLRNLLFTNSSNQYVSHLNTTHRHYGLNNDDVRLGGQAYTSIHDGYSYTYTPLAEDTIRVDSVRFYNDQIKQWTNILAENEKQKLEATPNEQHSNISFDNGAKYEGHIKSTASYNTHYEYEYTINNSVATEARFLVNGYGYVANLYEEVNKKTYELEDAAESKSMDVGFVLEDNDANNYFTVDIMDCPAGNGAVFRTKGGQSSCPYEGEELTKYYRPGNEVLNQATMSLNNPVINVDEATKTGVPEDEAAVYTLNLRNESDVKEDAWFVLKVNNASNPYGAKLFVDGSPLSSLGLSILIPANTAITKTLEVFKGAPERNDFENIELELVPACNVSDMKGVANINAHYVPACSKVTLKTPVDGWISNVYNNNIVPIEVNGFNTNLSTFHYIAVQVKNSSETVWQTLRLYYKTQADLDASTAEEEVKELINGRTTLVYNWDIKDYVDRNYQIRAISVCKDESQNITPIAQGIVDRKRPQPFGLPQPSDGELANDDNILVQFDEEIQSGLLLANPQFVTVQGVLNGTEIPNQVSLQFNGTNQYAIAQHAPVLQNTSFAFEAWVKRNAATAGTVWSVGEQASNQLTVSVSASGKVVLVDGSANYTSTQSLSTNNWYHIGVVYDKENKKVKFYINDQTDVTDNVTINSSPVGRMAFGYNHVAQTNYFNGNVRDIRIWKNARRNDDFQAEKSTLLSTNTPYLAAYYRTNEKFGSLLNDVAHQHNAKVYGKWDVRPQGEAVIFNGTSHFVVLDATKLMIDQQTDFTLELWFNAAGNSHDECLISSGKGDGINEPGAENAFSVMLTNSGIKMYSNGKEFTITNANYADNSFHHLAIVVKRKGTAKAFVDGELVSQTDANGFGGLSNGTIFLGARTYQVQGGPTQRDGFFNGILDDVRIWRSARTGDQIKTYMNNRLSGEEVGLASYYPFEKYELDGFEVMDMYDTLEDLKIPTPTELAANNAILSGATNTNNTAAIALQRPVTKVLKSIVVNNDKVLINLEDDAARLEGVLLEFSIRDVQDMNGNILASPVVWSAWVNQNPVKWTNNSLAFNVEAGSEYKFTATMHNRSGIPQSYYLGNLPAWLTASISSGTLSSMATQEVEFTVNRALNGGEYQQDIFLETGSGVNERLALTIKVAKPAPEWNVNAEDYEFAMNAIGVLSYNGTYSRNESDLVAVFNANGECRGVTPLLYVPQNDEYMVFLDMYGNASDLNQPYTVKVWNDLAGEINTNISIKDGGISQSSMLFQSGEFLGSTQSPLEFVANDTLEQSIPLAAGWNWLSFNLSSPELLDLNQVLSTVASTPSDVFKTAAAFENYVAGYGWFGSISATGGIKNTAMYQFKTSQKDTIVYNGVPVVPASLPIQLSSGWNWIGFTPRYSMSIHEALTGINPTANDVIKGQRDFAIYDSGLGWIGSLKSLKPTAGYMYLSKTTGITSFTYPNISSFTKSATISSSSVYEVLNITPEMYEGNMSLIARVENVDVADYYLLAKNNETVVGGAEAIRIEGFNYFFCTVYGNQSANLKFVLRNVKTGEEVALQQTMAYEKDLVVGSFASPFVFNANNATPIANVLDGINFNVWPNPFTDKLSISVSGEMGEHVQIRIMTVSGAVLGYLFDGNLNKQNQTFVFDATNSTVLNQAQGVYLVQCINAHQSQTICITKR